MRGSFRLPRSVHGSREGRPHTGQWEPQTLVPTEQRELRRLWTSRGKSLVKATELHCLTPEGAYPLLMTQLLLVPLQRRQLLVLLL